MKAIPLIGLLGLVCLTGSAFSATVTAPSERLVRDIDLQAFFHTAHPWRLKIYQPSGPDEPFGNRPVRVCFVGPMDATQTHADCTALFGELAQADGKGYPLQALDSAALQMLPGAGGRGSRPSVVIRATGGSGGPGELKELLVWTYTSLDQQGHFTRTFRSEVSQAGEQQFVAHGPLAGKFLALEQVHEGDEPNMESPVHYHVSVYEPAASGYVEVLGIFSKGRYPSNHTRDGLADAVTVLTPETSRAFNAVPD